MTDPDIIFCTVGLIFPIFAIVWIVTCIQKHISILYYREEHRSRTKMISKLIEEHIELNPQE